MQNKIFIPNNKGLKLSTIIHKPDSQGRFPAVLLFCGFTGYKEEEHISTLADALEQAGIAAIRFDPSGYGESEGSLEKDYRFSNYLQDAKSIYDHVSNSDYVDPFRMGVAGHSMGGLMSIVMSAHQSNIKAVCPISSPDIYTNSKTPEFIQDWQQKGYLERISSKFGCMKIPYAYVGDAKKYDGREYVKHIHASVLFVWGKQDITVWPKQTRAVFDAANQPKEFLEIEGMDHFYKKKPQILKFVNQKVVEFFRENL